MTWIYSFFGQRDGGSGTTCVARCPSPDSVVTRTGACALSNVGKAAILTWGTLAICGFHGGLGSDCPSSALSAAESLDLVRAAARSALDSITSGKGSGVFTRVLGPDATPQLDVRFELMFSGDKYRIGLEFRPVNGRSPRYPKIIAVCDGTAIASAVFADGIKPGGCRIHVYEAGYGPGMLATATANAMHHEPRRLPGQLYQIDFFRYDDPSIEDRGDGLVWLRRTTERVEREYAADPRQGLNIVTYRKRTKGDGGVVYETTNTGEWGQQDGVWFLRKLTEEDREDGTIVGCSVLAFDEFQVNPLVSDDEFKWDQLNLCADGVVVDQRPNAPSRGYKNVPSTDEDERRLDTLVERVKALPPTSPPAARSTGGSHRIWILVFALAATTCALAAYLLWRRARIG